MKVFCLPYRFFQICKSALTFLLLSAFLIAPAVGEEPRPVSFIADPPPTIDGTLKRFESTPGWLTLGRADQVVLGGNEWRGGADLSARVLVSWDLEHLYLAAKVVDRGMQQPYHGTHLWKGSHIMLLLDLPRKERGQRSREEIIHIGLSPGDPSREGAGAELFRWNPRAGEVAGAKVAAQATPGGYQLEAAIPWAALGIEAASEGMPIGIDVAVSSSDKPGEVMQNKVMSLLTSPWKLRDPDRLAEFLLADANGAVDPARIPRPALPLAEAIVKPDEPYEISLPASPEKINELVLQARLAMDKVAGGTHIMRVFLDGTELDLARSRNRGGTFDLGVRTINNYARGAWFVLYGPEFTPPARDSVHYVRGFNPFEFRFDVSGLWETGKPHRLRIEHSRPNAPALHIALGGSPQLSTRRVPPTPSPAPTGEIPTYEPKQPLEEGALGARLLTGGAIEATNGGQRWVVESAFSTTEPGWARFQADTHVGWEESNIPAGETLGCTAETRDYTVKRRIEPHRDHIVVRDTFTNRSETDVPILIRHEALVAAAKRTATYLCGRSFGADEMAVEEGENPASLALVQGGGIGLLSEDDVMRVQADNFFDNNGIGIRNNRFVLAKGKTVTLEFSIYPLERDDLFLFINRARRNWGVNQTIPGGFAIVGSHRKAVGLADPDEKPMRDYLENKNVNIAAVGFFQHDQKATHGNRFNEFSWEPLREYIGFLRMQRPGLKIIPYYHCFISNGQGDVETFSREAIVGGDGRQLDYGNRGLYPLFVPVEGSPFARLQEELIEKRFAMLGVDGIYWDEIEYSQAKYQFSPECWDGFTGDIDLRTHRLRRKISSVTLLTLPWRAKIAQKIMARGILVGNSQALTRTFTRLHFPRFIETASISNLVKGQLGTPIALGDHLGELNELDCYRNMVKGLDYGALYYWYSPKIVATHPTLTHYMFPITPVEMGAGFLIGEERILTNTSGFFGWGDESDFESHIFDANGHLTEKIKVSAIRRNGRVYAEVRIPEGYSVALVRKKR